MHDMLRMMDVASALRRERESAEAQLDLDAHKGNLRKRLLATAEASGEALTEAEVDASIEQYFDQQHRYEDPPPGWNRFWAHVWVARTRWLLAALLVTVLVFGSLALAHVLSKSPSQPGPGQPGPSQPGPSDTGPSDTGPSDSGPSHSVPSKATSPRTTSPQPAPAKPTTAPTMEQRYAKFEQAIAAAKALAANDDAHSRVDSIASQGAVANAGEDAKALASATTALIQLSQRLNQQYVVRIVDQANERSGVFRNFDGKLSGHYLIVEAITETGERVPRVVENSEDGTRSRVRKWGEQVPEAIYNSVGKDKGDDGVIDQRIFARKRRGHYAEHIVFEDGRGKPLKRGRTITKW